MESSQEVDRRLAELAAKAPLTPRGVWRREGNVVYLCGTIGCAFDAWQRARAAVSAADAYLTQRIGLDAVERVMDEMEEEIRRTLGPGERLLPRKSPGYGSMPLAMSRDIVSKLDATKRIGVAVTQADLLVPAKSVTAVCEVKT